MWIQIAAICVLIPLISCRCCTNTPNDMNAKLKSINHYNDRNGDGKVSLSEVKADLNENYDTNKDGKVSKVEFAINWNCLYGDEFGYALWLFNQIDRSKDGFIEISDVANGPIGKAPMAVSAFEQRNKQRYETYAKTAGIIG